MNGEIPLDHERRARRRELRQIHSEFLRQLLADYAAFASDQPVSEKHVAARLQKSRAWVQLKRCSGGGPKFHRTDTGKIFYLKRDVEAYLRVSLTPFESTSQYPDAVRP